MTNEEAIRFLSNYLDEEVYSEKCIDAHGLAICALRDEAKRKETEFLSLRSADPLTIEQMRKLEGDPVWVTHPLEKESGCWALVTHMSVDPKTMRAIFIVLSGDDTRVILEDNTYGKTWVAYTLRQTTDGN